MENKTSPSPDRKPICGIMMPISGNKDYSKEHWNRIKKVISTAIIRAAMEPLLVWEKPEVDIIHSRILQNIYESDVVIADVSDLNPNVMLELGLRLSTKRPTIVITDGEEKPPFDLAAFQYHIYPKNLEYNAIESFINEISGKLNSVYSSYRDDKYKSFVESFTFEVVEPSEVTIPAEEALRDRLDDISDMLRKLEQSQRTSSVNKMPFTTLSFTMFIFSNREAIERAMEEIRSIYGVLESSFNFVSDGLLNVNMRVIPSIDKNDFNQLKDQAERIIRNYADEIPF